MQCDDSLACQGEWLADVVESMEREGKELVVGTSIQVGWSILRLVQVNAQLELCEPDFANNPYEDISHDTSTTLKILMRQNELLSKLGCSGAIARFDEKIVLEKGCLDVNDIYAERQSQKSGDSGWFIGSVDGEGKKEICDLEAIKLYQLLQLRTHILDVMNLPVGCLVVWNGNDIDSIMDSENRSLL